MLSFQINALMLLWIMNNLDAVKGKPTDGVTKLGVKLLLDYVLEYI